MFFSDLTHSEASFLNTHTHTLNIETQNNLGIMLEFFRLTNNAVLEMKSCSWNPQMNKTAVLPQTDLRFTFWPMRNKQFSFCSSVPQKAAWLPKEKEESWWHAVSLSYCAVNCLHCAPAHSKGTFCREGEMTCQNFTLCHNSSSI